MFELQSYSILFVNLIFIITIVYICLFSPGLTSRRMKSLSKERRRPVVFANQDVKINSEGNLNGNRLDLMTLHTLKKRNFPDF